MIRTLSCLRVSVEPIWSAPGLSLWTKKPKRPMSWSPRKVGRLYALESAFV